MIRKHIPAIGGVIILAALGFQVAAELVQFWNYILKLAGVI